MNDLRSTSSLASLALGSTSIIVCLERHTNSISASSPRDGGFVAGVAEYNGGSNVTRCFKIVAESAHKTTCHLRPSGRGESSRASSLDCRRQTRASFSRRFIVIFPRDICFSNVRQIFGATGHLGRSLVRAVTAHGDKVTSVGWSQADDPQELASWQNENSIGLLCDVRVRESVDVAIKKSLCHWGRIDIVAK
jgi:hypothetical protein